MLLQGLDCVQYPYPPLARQCGCMPWDVHALSLLLSLRSCLDLVVVVGSTSLSGILLQVVQSFFGEVLLNSGG